MSRIKELEEQYKIGQVIFEELFKLDDQQLAKKLISILDGDNQDILNNKFRCVRTIVDSTPDTIKFWYYDGLCVDWSGITLEPEHGVEVKLVKFNKHFKL